MRQRIVFLALMLVVSLCVNAQQAGETDKVFKHLIPADFANYGRNANMSTEDCACMQEAFSGIAYPDEANKTLEQGKVLSQKGYAVGYYFLGWCYEAGEGGAPVDKKEAMKCFMKAVNAEIPFSWAYISLSSHYFYGDGVAVDYQKAFYWVKKAVESVTEQQQLSWCWSQIGNSYHEGLGVEKDEAAAIRAYEKAAKYGSSVAAQNLAKRYMVGRDGIAKDSAKGFYWMEQAGLLGDTEALYFTALSYIVGSFYFDHDYHIAADIEKGKKYLRIAAQKGLKEAQTTLQQIESGK